METLKGAHASSIRACTYVRNTAAKGRNIEAINQWIFFIEVSLLFAPQRQHPPHRPPFVRLVATCGVAGSSSSWSPWWESPAVINNNNIQILLVHSFPISNMLLFISPWPLQQQQQPVMFFAVRTLSFASPRPAMKNEERRRSLGENFCLTYGRGITRC